MKFKREQAHCECNICILVGDGGAGCGGVGGSDVADGGDCDVGVYGGGDGDDALWITFDSVHPRIFIYDMIAVSITDLRRVSQLILPVPKESII